MRSASPLLYANTTSATYDRRYILSPLFTAFSTGPLVTSVDSVNLNFLRGGVPSPGTSVMVLSDSGGTVRERFRDRSDVSSGTLAAGSTLRS